MMKKFLFYIVFALCLFNPFEVFSEQKRDFAEELLESANPGLRSYYEVRNFTKEEILENKPQRLLSSNNEFFLLLALPSIVDKLYEGELLQRDITPFLSAVYPEASERVLLFSADLLKNIVYMKRVYRNVIASLRYKIKAKSIVPQDAPIIAKKGEFLDSEEDVQAEFKPMEYNVNYNPYKYIDFDNEDFGEPVRRRDKNYIPAPDTDELNLALLRFDIKGIIKALSEIPTAVDYSAEKMIELDNGLKAGILLDHNFPGDVDEIKGAIVVHIPEGYYINGDYLNKKVKPRFIFNENSEYSLNVKDFTLYHPLALGVEKDGIHKRILVDIVRFPFTVTRNSKKKSLYIEGNFGFELCNENDECSQVSTQHFIRLKPSSNTDISLFNNYITQSHTHLPEARSKNVSIKDVYIDKENKKLNVYFDTKHQVNNVSAMSEDAYSNFIIFIKNTLITSCYIKLSNNSTII